MLQKNGTAIASPNNNKPTKQTKHENTGIGGKAKSSAAPFSNDALLGAVAVAVAVATPLAGAWSGKLRQCCGVVGLCG